MLRIDQLEDKDALKQAALLLDCENAKLHKKIVELTEENARLKGQDATAAQLQLLYLKELLASRERALVPRQNAIPSVDSQNRPLIDT